jgi:hypothetical protein
MRVRDRPGEYPTVKLSVDELARYAREADARVVEAESRARQTTKRPEPREPAGDPDIEVTVELADASLGDLNLREGLDEGALYEERSNIRLARVGGDGPLATSIPCVVASKEDLSWFQLDETSHVVLAMIDGESSVESIVSTLSIPRISALAILRELGTHGVIEFH